VQGRCCCSSTGRHRGLLGQAGWYRDMLSMIQTRVTVDGSLLYGLFAWGLFDIGDRLLAKLMMPMVCSSRPVALIPEP
jgi:hypothetical protein